MTTAGFRWMVQAADHAARLLNWGPSDWEAHWRNLQVATSNGGRWANDPHAIAARRHAQRMLKRLRKASA